MHPTPGRTRRLSVAMSAAVLSLPLLSAATSVQAITPAREAAPGAASWAGFVEPVLATSDAGQHLLLARRNAHGRLPDGRFGQVVATLLPPGATRWSRIRALSSQHATAGLAADIASGGAGRTRGLVAWTSGGNVYVRNLLANGSWGSQLKLSRRTGTRWVTVDVNKAGDQLVGWRQGQSAYLAYRAAGGRWHRWLGQETSQRPVAALSERSAGVATARIVWLSGEGDGTAVRQREFFLGVARPSAEAALAARPDIRSFDWSAGTTRQVLALAHRTPEAEADPETDATNSTITTYDGPLGGPLEARWSQKSTSPQSGLAVDVNGSAARVSWIRYQLSESLLDSYVDVLTRVSTGEVWSAEKRLATDGPNITFTGLGQDVAGQSRSLLGYRADEGGGHWYGTVFRLPDAVADPATVLLNHVQVVSSASPVAVSVATAGKLSAAWTSGTPARPTLRVRTFAP